MKKYYIIIAILCILFIVQAYFLYKSSYKQTNINDTTDQTIDSIYIVRDSLVERIDTVYKKIDSNNKQYEEDFKHIISNDVNEDYSFFLEYITANRERLDSISNSF